MSKIKSYPEYKGVFISKDYNVYDERVYIGNGQGCSTFWFKDAKDARKFIDRYEKKIKISNCGHVSGLIPKKLCLDCKCHYSYGTKKWQKVKDYNCKSFKEELKK